MNVSTRPQNISRSGKIEIANIFKVLQTGRPSSFVDIMYFACSLERAISIDASLYCTFHNSKGYYSKQYFLYDTYDIIIILSL